MTTISTELEIVAKGRVALRQQGATLLTVAEALMADEPAFVSPQAVEFPPLPAKVEITKTVTDALALLPTAFGKVQPAIRRSLTPKEIADLYRERNVLRDIGKVLDNRDESIKEYIRNHIDCDAESRNVAVPKSVVDPDTGEIIVEATQRDVHGHYVLASRGKPVRVPIQECNEEWSSEFRAGEDQVVIDGHLLEGMLKDGEITRVEYLSLTREVRVFDEEKAFSSINNDPSLLDTLAKITRKVAGVPSTALFVRSKKN